MSVLSCRAGRESGGVFSGKTSTVGGASGWEGGITAETLKYEFINAANSSVSLYSVLEQYNISFEQVYSTNGWTHRCICPFPEHSDRNPSFSYNSIEDRFHCFG